MKGIHQGKRGRFRQRGINDIFITDNSEQRPNTKAKTRIHTVRMNVKAYKCNQECQVHSKKHLPKQPACIARDREPYPEVAIL